MSKLEIITLISVVSVPISFLVGLAANATWDFIRLIIPAFHQNEFTVSGLWVSSVNPKYGLREHSIEIYKILQRKEEVIYHMENYNSARSSILKLKGRAYVRSGRFSGCYIHKSRSLPDSGTFTLKLISATNSNPVMSGVYTELIERDGQIKKNPISQEIKLLKIGLPLKQQLRAVIGMPYFGNYEQAKLHFEWLLTEEET